MLNETNQILCLSAYFVGMDAKIVSTNSEDAPLSQEKQITGSPPSAMFDSTDILYGCARHPKSFQNVSWSPVYQGEVTWEQLRPTSALEAADRSYLLSLPAQKQVSLAPGVLTGNLANEFLTDIYHCFETEPMQVLLRPRNSGLEAVRNDPP